MNDLLFTVIVAICFVKTRERQILFAEIESLTEDPKVSHTLALQ